MNELTKTGLRVNYWFLMAISGLMLVGGLVAIIFFVRTNIMANKKIAETAEAKRPANLEIIGITDASCTDCFNINQVLTYIKQENVTVTTEKTLSNTSEEGKQLIQQFAIKKLHSQ